MAHPNQVNKERFVLSCYKQTSRLNTQTATVSFALGRKQRRTQHMRAVGHECAIVICEAMSCLHYLQLMALLLYSTLNKITQF